MHAIEDIPKYHVAPVGPVLLGVDHARVRTLKQRIFEGIPLDEMVVPDDHHALVWALGEIILEHLNADAEDSHAWSVGPIPTVISPEI